MNSMIYNPQEEYDQKFKSLHESNTNQFFDGLVKRSGVDVEENRRTVKEHQLFLESLKKLKRKLFWWKFLRVLACITLILIPLVILKITPKIRALREEIELANQKADALLNQAYAQMAPLNALFTDRDALEIIEKTIPMLSFAPCFSVEQETNMRVNYDFDDRNDEEQSTVDVLAGSYQENPFLFESKVRHQMGMETYHGSKTIYWTETYRGSDGKTHTRTRSQTLYASVTKPKPFYHSQIILNYCAQGGPDLSFSRDATNLDEKSDKEIDRYVKKGEKKLKKKTDEALKQNKDFVSMSNTDFEVLFDALDRTDEVQFRTLFTPLAQTNMVDLIRSDTGYGDDFCFIKQKRTNRIVTEHSQGRAINLRPSDYISYDFDVIKESFISKNTKFFKDVYFDFAPVWAIPVYQERPVHSLKPLPNYTQLYSFKEYESLANAACARFVHPATKTRAILKTSYVGSNGNEDTIRVTAYSYDILPRIDVIPVMGGDGRMHGVPVPWDDYIPLETTNAFRVASVGPDGASGANVIAQRGNLCILN